MNTCIFSGTIFTDFNTKAPINVEMKSYNGQQFASCFFKVSQSEKTGTDAQGKAIYKNTLIPCKASGKTAELLGKYFPHGKAVTIECEYEQYTVDRKINGQVVIGHNGQPEKEYKHIFKVVKVHFVPQDKAEVSSNYDNKATGQQINNQGIDGSQIFNQGANFNNTNQGNFSGQGTFQQPSFNANVNNGMYGFNKNNNPYSE